MSEQEATAHLESVSHAYHDAGIKSHEAASLHSLSVHYSASPLSDETLQEWTIESRRQLRQRYGRDADHRINKVKQFLAERPDFAKTLNETGMGSHPTLMIKLAENANMLRLAPRKVGR